VRLAGVIGLGAGVFAAAAWLIGGPEVRRARAIVGARLARRSAARHAPGRGDDRDA